MSFENAAVTKGLVVYCALSSLLVGIFDIKHYFHIQFVPHISRYHQYWRLITHHLAFTNSSDLFLGELILYNVGIRIERQFGSLKFASFAFISLLVSTLLEFVALILFHKVGLNHIAMGPSAFIFSLLYQYSRIVPGAYAYRIFGLPLSNKSTNYLLAFQLAISRLPGSALSAIIGVMTGQIYRSDLAGLNTYRLSPSIIRFAQKFLYPLIGSLRPPRRSNRALPDDLRTGGPRPDSSQHNEEVITTAQNQGPSGTPATAGDVAQPRNGPSVMREWVDELTGRADRANTGLRVPTESEISHLTAMFPTLEREVVIGALQRSPNIEAAVETLLASQT
ncbi:hypothetical protein CPB84DRAFT_1758985 [Gymnopilus junonius]|uniref:CUE domain-containing protein n=1 Tax=Gymnopilus junonius TaxID=109634 RepID=A0A9P5TVE2_GYMJU|nr:hypothetical protein CPB84DRAFT_1758985 [Gymnopilus junonius]